MAYYGRHVTNGDMGLGEVGASQQRATVYNRMPENGWGYRIGFWGGRYSGSANPTMRLAVWAVSGSMTPAHRLGYTGAFTVSATQSYGGDGQSYEYAVTNATTSPAPNAIKMYAGHRYAIGVQSSNLGTFAMVHAANLPSADNKYLYNRNGVSAPTDPFGHTSSSHEGWISAWIVYQPNRAPTAATSAPNGLITTTTPTFTGTFSDPDSTYGDRMTRVRIQVIRASDGALMWDSGSLVASSNEQASRSFSRAYNGTALAAGVEYRWRCQVADEFGTWSAWTAYRSFTVNGGGMVTATSPTGRQNTLQPTPFSGRWTHASALAMNAVEVRIKQGGSVIRTSGTIAKSVSNNGTISVTWSEAFGSYSLAWGVTNYTFEMRGRDTGNLWSAWSSGVSFSTNTPPDVPYSLSPTNSQPSSSRPKLVCHAKDANGDNVTVKARIKNSGGTLIATRTMTHVGNGRYEYQTTSSDLATHATYRWDAYSHDGYLWSGGVTSEASATKSAEAIFIYGQGPEVTITSPGTTVTTGSPTVTWTAADQQKYQVVLRQGSTVIYDSGTITSAAQSHTIPSGYIRNGQTYDLTVTVTNSAPLSGTSPIVSFTVVYPTPEQVHNLVASPEYQPFDVVPSAIRLTWDESDDPNFLEYLVTRLDPDGTETILARIASPSQTVFVDHLPVSGVEYTYRVVQATVQGLDITVSEPAETQATVILENVILVNVHDAASSRASLRLDGDRGFEHVDDLVLEHAWGAAAPIGVYGTTQYQKFSGSFTLASDEVATAADHITALRALWRSRATVCYRDDRGRKFFAKISRFTEDDQRIERYTVSVELTEVGYREGVS